MLVDLALNTTDATGPVAIEAARGAEAAGFDGVWTYDHLSGAVFGGKSILEAWTLLGAIAASTTRITVGPLVTNATIRHPALIAVASATLQSVSGGRFVLGLGAGAGPESPFASELSMVGLPAHRAAERRERVRECVFAIRGLWAGTRNGAGQSFPLVDADGFATPEPTPPIIIGANGPKMASLAVEVGDGVVFHAWDPHLEALIEAVRSPAAEPPMIVVVAPFEDDWRSGPERDRLEELGVDRMALAWRSRHGLDAIAR